MSHPRHFARSIPDAPAIVVAETGETVSYAALESAADRGAQVLRAHGVRSGDAIALWLPNDPRYLEIFWAGQRAGVYVTLVPVQLTAEEAAYILRDSGAKLLVTAPVIAAAQEFVTAREHLAPDLAAIFSIGGPLEGCGDWDAELADAPDRPIADEAAGLHFVYSSGTTGKPKGVRLPLPDGPADAPYLLAERLRGLHGLAEDTVYLSPAPLYHTAPMVMCAAVQRYGGTVVLMRKFDAEAALAAIARYRATLTQMVPTMFQRILRLPPEVRDRYDLSSLRRVIHAAAPCPVPVKRAMIDWLGPIIWEYYAGSEGVGSTTITSEEWLRKPGSVGRASLGVIHICDPDGEELPVGEAGQVYFEGASDFRYHKDDTKTRESRHPRHGNWATLGDIGYVDEDGYLFLTDRKSFMIVSGGVNIYPQEAENLLSGHPKVADVAVIGVPDAEMGEAVKAVVQPVRWEDAGPDLADELIAYCRTNLSAVKCPRSVDFDPQLPREDTGKLFKRKIRDRYWEGRATRIAG